MRNSVSDDGHARFDDPRFVEAFSFYLDIYRRGLAPAQSNNVVTNLYQQFGEGEFAMFISGPWDVGNLRFRLGRSGRENGPRHPLPAPDGLPYPGVVALGGIESGAQSRSDKQRTAAAWKLIEFLSRPEIQVRFFELSGDLPARRSAWNAPGLVNDREIAAFRAQLDHTVALPRLPEWENIATSIFEHGQLAALGAFDAREGAHRLDAKVEAMLEKRRWVLSRTEGRSHESGR